MNNKTNEESRLSRLKPVQFSRMAKAYCKNEIFHRIFWKISD